MSKIPVPEFNSYKEEAEFWDNLDLTDFITEDDEWFHFDTDNQRAVQVAIFPVIAHQLMERAHKQGVTMETLVNILLIESMHHSDVPVRVTIESNKAVYEI